MRGQTKNQNGRASTSRVIQVRSGVPLGQLMGGYKSEMPGRNSSFQGYDMGCPASNKDSSVYPERLSLKYNTSESPTRDLDCIGSQHYTLL
eukprot:2861649-Pleurochrysis_carterae.AAC.1